MKLVVAVVSADDLAQDLAREFIMEFGIGLADCRTTDLVEVSLLYRLFTVVSLVDVHDFPIADVSFRARVE